MVIITKIHNKYYNIENFKHPGGDEAIWHSFGRDATAMFEMYHPFANKEKIQNYLNKYEVSAEEGISYLLPGEDTMPQFEYDTDFSKEIKAEVLNYFQQEADKNNTSLRKITKASYDRWMLIGFLNLLRFFSIIWWLSGSIYGLFAFPLFSWLSSVNTFHDACHFSLSDNSNINKFFSYFAIEYYTPLVWYYEHNISHHSYTNMERKDVDLYHGSSLVRYSKYTKFKLLYKFQNISIIIPYLLSNIGTEIRNIIITIYKKEYFGIIPKYIDLKSNKREITDKTIFLIHFLFRYCYLWYWFNNIFYVLIPMLLSNILFMTITQVTHLHEDTFHNEKDWYKHQVLTSSNHSIESFFNFIFSGGLNYQIEHHLFPGVNHCHYPSIQPIVERICKKHDINYKKFNSYYDAFYSYYKHIKVLSKEKNNY
jgi:fatty acid desaturase